MVVKSLSSYLRDADINGCVVGSWAESTDLLGVARCKFCHSVVKFKFGKKGLFNHSEMRKHTDNVKKANDSSAQIQLNINTAFENADQRAEETIAVENKVREFGNCAGPELVSPQNELRAHELSIRLSENIVVIFLLFRR